MAERRRPAAVRPPTKIKQLETRLAQIEADLAHVRAQASRSGLTQIRLADIEKAMAAHVKRAQAGLRDSVNRLGRSLRSVRSRDEAARQIARAREGVKESLDRLARTLADSQHKVSREVSLLTRGLKAGVRAGRAAYRGRRR
ncbi:MAG TPA: hypothetical protein VEL75_04370 [Candidatus Methylomirabilis sp.]|nr:hypothetical protein [Candidatus Methylomirabilis sp.]